MESIEFSKQQKEIIIGVMLGDGYMRKIGKTVQFEIEQAFHHKEWVEQLKPLLGLENRPTESRYKQATNGAKGNKTLCYRFFKTNKAFIPIWESFYLPKKDYMEKYGYFSKQNVRQAKIIPINIELTPLVLYHWYLGDGTLKGKRPVFCTLGFPKKELEKLIPKFEKLGIKAELKFTDIPQYTRGSNGYQIYVSANSADKFFKLIGPCITSGFEHKWRK